jgi:hypothetical protein
MGARDLDNKTRRTTWIIGFARAPASPAQRWPSWSSSWGLHHGERFGHGVGPCAKQQRDAGCQRSNSRGTTI